MQKEQKITIRDCRRHLSSPVRKYRGLYYFHLDAGVGNLRVYDKDFYVMGKALSGELSCARTGLVFLTIVHGC